MKRVLALIVSLCCAFALAACSEGTTVTSSEGGEELSSAAKKNYSISEMGSLLRENATYEDDIQPLGENATDAIEFVSVFYGLEQSAIAEAVFYSGSGATPEEICVIKAAAGKINDVKTAMNNRVATLKQDFTDYNPEQMPKIDKAIVYVYGDYAVLSISCDDTQAKQVIENYFE